MKFLCDNCKAKYQIADEKVAGKTVRMKCRKCGHQIEVRAAVTETSVSTSLPSPDAGATAPRPAAGKGGLATSLSAQKPRSPSTTGPNPSASGALAGAFQRHVSDAPQAPQTQPMPPQGPVELSVTDEWYVAINGVPVGPVRISELRRKAAGGAVTEDSLCWQEGLEEWRPVRSIPELAALVREAAQGNRPSLVGTPPPPEGRASSPPARPAPARPQAPAAPLARSASSPGMNAVNPAAFAPTQPQQARSNVVPLRTGAAASAAGLGGLDDMPSTSPMGGAAGTGPRQAAMTGALAPAFTPEPAPFAPFAPPAPVADPFAIPPADPFAVPAGAGAATSPSSPLFAPAPAPALGGSAAGGVASAASAASPSMMPMAPAQRRGVPLWFWPILLFTGVFGAAAAFLVFKQTPPQTVIIQAPPVASTPATIATNDIPLPATSATEPAASASGAASAASTGTKVATATKAGSAGGTAPTAPPKQGIDLGGLVPSGGGPNVGGASGGGPSAGGGGLDSSSVQRVVASHQSGVKRTCWERGGDQKSSVNVTVSAQVGPAGNVVGTSSSGDDPVVAKCIENQVKTWMFSAPGSTTTVNIPFKFVRQ